MLYLSRYSIQHQSDYYHLLMKVTTNQNGEEWILYRLQAVCETAISTAVKIKNIRILIEQAAQRIREAAPQLYSRELTD